MSFPLPNSQHFSLHDYIQWLEGIIDAIHDGILVIDANGIVQHINQEYTVITGVSKQAIIGKPLQEIRPGAQLPLTLTDGKYRSGIYRKEGKKEYVVDMAPIIHRDRVIGAVSVCKSVSEVHALTKELSLSKKRVAQLEKAVGHLHRANYTFPDIVGAEGGLKKVIQQARKIATSALNVLITGESGTGKELFAQAIHQSSHRKNAPFVAVNCAAIPLHLLESELFGYEEGAFTHSKHGGKMGLFELAHTGTLFLDEIGDMTQDLQAKLLRVLQEGRIRRVGGLEEREIDVRVIAATNKDLQAMVEKKRFRDDLYYRLNVVHLSIPPLRQRKQDLAAIVSSLIRQRPRQAHFTIDPEAMVMLHQYDWPGNIRELKNTIDYALNIADGETITSADLPETLRRQVFANPAPSADRHLKTIVEQAEYQAIVTVLQETGYDGKGKKEAAKRLGISLATLYNKLSYYKMKGDF
ncbi:sigma-54 interaction domain-containing protein [Desmospora activa]|uniref:PAS domain S-box-containing protein n=1 Tax=Desmospora activa DSM 45169 TaxID=1121389 RepID=A0A2T4Z9C8_9BACL|nr:sigma 54-interacting transcriptional regulator [Desmospora activa]PTM58480.1 PAS domain S-box-containing protein [Desmospora activa DSM 45169]